MKKKLLIFCLLFLFLIVLIFIIFNNSDNNYPVYKVVGYKDNVLYKDGISFVYRSDDYAYLLTNYHVIENCDSIYIVINDKKIQAELLNYDEYEDVTILYIDSKYVDSFLTLDNNYDYNVGNKISIITTNDVLSGKLLSDIYPYKIHFNYSYKMLDLFKFNSKIVDGNSGSPVLSNNKVIGMVSMVDINSNNSFAIPSKNLLSIISNLESGDNYRVVLGIDYSNYNDGFSGVKVDNVYDDTLANNYGIVVGDVIINIDGHEVNDTLEFNYYLSKVNNKDSFLIKYYRDGVIYDSIIYLNN